MLTVQKEPAPALDRQLPLENGDRLDSREFLRRFSAMPHLKKAELVKGRVYMGSPVRSDLHGEPDALIHTWLGTYISHTPGVVCSVNTTLIVDPKNTFQPDAVLYCQPPRASRCRLDEGGYLRGAPELVVEIAASSVSIDLTDKRDVYRRAGVREYLVWRTAETALDWFVLVGEQYSRSEPDAHGIQRSRAFPGLDMNVAALLARDGAQVLAALQRGLKSKAHSNFVRFVGK